MERERALRNSMSNDGQRKKKRVEERYKRRKRVHREMRTLTVTSARRSVHFPSHSSVIRARARGAANFKSPIFPRAAVRDICTSCAHSKRNQERERERDGDTSVTAVSSCLFVERQRTRDVKILRSSFVINIISSSWKRKLRERV